MTLVLGFGLWATRDIGPAQRLEWLSEEARLWTRAKLGQPEPTGRVVVLGIDELSVTTPEEGGDEGGFGGFGQWPFPRSVHGELMSYLAIAPEERPAVLAWDILFVDRNFRPEMDAAMASPIPALGFPVVMGAQLDPVAPGLLSDGKPVRSHGVTKPLARAEGELAGLRDHRGGLLPIPALLEVASFGILTADADSDGVVRKFPLVARVGDEVFASLVLQTLLAYWRAGPEDVEIRPGRAVLVRTGDGLKRIPIDADGYYHVNYRYELTRTVALASEADESGAEAVEEVYPQGIQAMSYGGFYRRQVKRFGFGEDLPAPDLAGKIVIVGQIAAGLTDIGPSALLPESPKVMVHVNALENILRDDYLPRWPLWPVLTVLLLAGLGLTALLDRGGLSGRAVVVYAGGVVLIGLLVWVVAQGLLSVAGQMVFVAWPLVGFAAQQGYVTIRKIREEQALRDRIRGMFGSYVSPELVNRMVDSGQEPRLGGHEAEITAFFSDIQSFSSFSEVLTPSDLGELLNQYLGAMTDELQRHGGALDKYIGDAIVAMFGAPVPLPAHARAACEAAALMQNCQANLRAKWTAEGDRWPPLVHAMRTRIGLNSGRVIVGNMGSSHRFNYTMMGDAVNLAARCESGAKSFGVYTLVTESTVSLARAQGARCVFRELDRIVVKGRSQPVEIFELVGLEDDVTPAVHECLGRFAKGRAHYLRQEWAAAIEAFGAAAGAEPFQPGRDPGVEANPSLVMLERCRRLCAEPPPADWDGVYRMTTK
ncbi:MAG: adenylate/guanylate cyclase domain-containing protein [Verrucomicrobiota bacterium]